MDKPTTTIARTPRHDFFSQMRREIDQAFDHWLLRRNGSWLGEWPTAEGIFTPYELSESDAEYVVRVDVPGMSEKDLKVSYQNETLTVSGERKEEKSETKGATRYTERSYGSFVRSIDLPGVKVEDVRARCKDGVMEIHLPKTHKTAARQIPVQAGT